MAKAATLVASTCATHKSRPRKGKPKSRTHAIATVKDAMRALGGRPARAAPIDNSGWVEQGWIERGYYLHTCASLQARGFEQSQINPKIFGGLRRWAGITIAA